MIIINYCHLIIGLRALSLSGASPPTSSLCQMQQSTSYLTIPHLNEPSKEFHGCTHCTQVHMVIFLNKIMASCSNIRIVHMTDDWRSKSIPDPKVMFLAHNTGQNVSRNRSVPIILRLRKSFIRSSERSLIERYLSVAFTPSLLTKDI